MGALRFVLLLSVAPLHAQFFGDADSMGYAYDVRMLDPARPESVCAARDELRAKIGGASELARVEMVRTFRAFYLKSVATTRFPFIPYDGPVAARIGKVLRDAHYSRAQSGGAAPVLSKDPEVDSVLGPWLKCGFSVYTEEGGWYPDADPDAVVEFIPRLTSPMAEYVTFRAREDRQQDIGHANIVIPLDDFGERIWRWESFARQHPQLPESDTELLPAVRRMTSFFLFGIDNRRTCREAGEIEPDFIRAWRSFAAKHPESALAPLLKAAVSRLDAHANKFTPEDRPIYEQAGLGAEFSAWWCSNGPHPVR